MSILYTVILGISLSEWVSIISLSLAIISFLYSWNTSKKIDKQQIIINKYVISNYENEKDNMKKADIECSTFPSGEKYKCIMRIKNCGKSKANNIVFIIVDDDEKRMKMYIPKEFSPYPELLSGHFFDIKYEKLIRCKDCYEILFTWDDEYRKGREKRQTINV